jgi:hypothetical protein
VTLSCDGRTITTPYSQGSAHQAPPQAKWVLWSLGSDAQMGQDTFEEFCGDLGYDTDSRKAYETWQACRDMDLQLRRFAGSANFEDFLADVAAIDS